MLADCRVIARVERQDFSVHRSEAMQCILFLINIQHVSQLIRDIESMRTIFTAPGSTLAKILKVVTLTALSGKIRFCHQYDTCYSRLD